MCEAGTGPSAWPEKLPVEPLREARSPPEDAGSEANSLLALPSAASQESGDDDKGEFMLLNGAILGGRI